MKRLFCPLFSVFSHPFTDPPPAEHPTPETCFVDKGDCYKRSVFCKLLTGRNTSVDLSGIALVAASIRKRKCRLLQLKAQ